MIDALTDEEISLPGKISASVRSDIGGFRQHINRNSVFNKINELENKIAHKVKKMWRIK